MNKHTFGEFLNNGLSLEKNNNTIIIKWYKMFTLQTIPYIENHKPL